MARWCLHVDAISLFRIDQSAVCRQCSPGPVHATSVSFEGLAFAQEATAELAQLEFRLSLNASLD